MNERLQKILSARGVASRRKAEEMITQGRVLLNGSPAHLGETADPAIDEILIDGKPLPAETEPVYLMLHKPRGVVTTLSDEKGRANAAQLVQDCGVRVWPIGRLDMDSEGLLLFTNDGDFTQMVAHPKGLVDKQYRVWVKDYVPGAEHRLAQPVILDGYRIAKPEVRLLWAEEVSACMQITIHEGRNRQVRRMCALCGLKVTKLLRVAEGAIRLGDLPRGKWRYLTSAEIAELRRHGGGNHGK